MGDLTARHRLPGRSAATRRARHGLAQLLCCVVLGAPGGASRADDGGTTAPSVAQLTSARGDAIGVVSGRSTGFDGDANTVGAYGVVSARGYFADVLPSGEIGQVPSLVYAAADCGGAPAIEQASVVGGPLPVPGYVFAFGAPAQIFNVPAGASLRDIEVSSERQRTRTGYACVAMHKRAKVYPLVANRAEVSGFADRYAGPLKIKMTVAQTTNGVERGGATPRPAAAVPDESAAGADLPLDTPECAPGCFMPYLGDHICESECANSLCGYDSGDCSAAYVERAKQREAAMCAPTCEAASVGDGFCDAACNVASCEFDHGDCRKTPRTGVAPN